MNEKIIRAIVNFLYLYLIEKIKTDYSYDKFASEINNDDAFHDKINDLMTIVPCHLCLHNLHSYCFPILNKANSKVATEVEQFNVDIIVTFLEQHTGHVEICENSLIFD